MSTSSASPALELIYFDGRGRAETSRLVLAAAGAHFVDTRVKREDWPALKASMPYGQMPVLKISEPDTSAPVLLAQSGAIERYLAARFGLLPSHPVHAALAHATIDHIRDLMAAGLKVHYTANPDEKAAALKTFVEETVPRHFAQLSAQLGDRDYFVGDKLSLADILFLRLLDPQDSASLVGNVDIVSNFPKLAALAARVRALPGIAAHYANRPATAF